MADRCSCSTYSFDTIQLQSHYVKVEARIVWYHTIIYQYIYRVRSIRYIYNIHVPGKNFPHVILFYPKFSLQAQFTSQVTSQLLLCPLSNMSCAKIKTETVSSMANVHDKHYSSISSRLQIADCQNLRQARTTRRQNATALLKSPYYT